MKYAGMNRWRAKGDWIEEMMGTVGVFGEERSMVFWGIPPPL